MYQNRTRETGGGLVRESYGKPRVPISGFDSDPCPAYSIDGARKRVSIFDWIGRIVVFTVLIVGFLAVVAQITSQING